MAVTIEQRAPSARCHDCGSAKVHALCHHCWRPACAEHARPTPRWAERLFGAEGRGPGLKKTPAWHCANCVHVRLERWLVTGVFGAVAACAGLVLLVVSPVPGAVLMMAGVAAACWCYARIRRRIADSRAGLPVSLHPKVSNVRVRERLQARITLGATDGDYQVEKDPVEGTLSALFTFGHSDRVRARNRDETTRYIAGALVPQGRIGAVEFSGSPVIRVDVSGADVPVLSLQDPPASSPWPLERPYTLSIPPDADAGPVWITPSIVPESDRRALELDIQWPEIGPRDGADLTLDAIESLTISVPASWGKVRGVARARVVVSHPEPSGEPENGPARLTIKWRNLLPTEAEARNRRLTLTIQFEEQISGQDAVSGDLTAIMKGALSGITGVRMYSALGDYRSVSGKISVQTRLEAEFTLSLASIRYQSVKAYPDRASREGEHGDDVIESDAIPDDDTLVALTNALGEDDFYVKRLAENPPRGGTSRKVIHRSWDIAGRSYDGVNPIDFHLIVSGDEVHAEGLRPESGHTRIQISVQGAYTSEEMRMYVENVWTRLRQVVQKALGEGQP